MSLLKSHIIMVAAAGVLAVVIPWMIVSTDPEVRDVYRPFTSSSPPIPSVAPIASGAMQGRLFFGSGTEVEYGAVNDANAMSQQTSSGGAPLPPPQLSGTIIRRRGPALALVRLASGETRMVSRGDLIDEWRVENIRQDSVALTARGVSLTIELPRTGQSGQVDGSTGSVNAVMQ